MVGSTERADGADPEDVRDLNRRYHQELRDRIERFGGVVEKFIGDAVMAVFERPWLTTMTPNAPFAPRSTRSKGSRS